MAGSFQSLKEARVVAVEVEKETERPEVVEKGDRLLCPNPHDVNPHRTPDRGQSGLSPFSTTSGRTDDPKSPFPSQSQGGLMWTQAQQALNQSLIRVLDQLASLIPGIAALMLAVIFSALIGGVLYVALRRVLAGVQFDERLPKWGFRWSPARSPSMMVARVVFWTLVLVVFFIVWVAFSSALTSRLVLRLFGYLPNVLAAALVLLIGSVLARYLARSVLIGAVNMNLQYAR